MTVLFKKKCVYYKTYNRLTVLLLLRDESAVRVPLIMCRITHLGKEIDYESKFKPMPYIMKECLVMSTTVDFSNTTNVLHTYIIHTYLC